MPPHIPDPTPAELLAFLIFVAVMAAIITAVHWAIWSCGCYT
jgi:hypothetical protein